MNSIKYLTEYAPRASNSILGEGVMLFPHQTAIIQQIISSEQWIHDINHDQIMSNLMAISCPPGSGKSYIVLAMMSISPIGIKSVIQESNIVRIRTVNQNLPQLIIVPFGLVAQWKKYISNTNLKDICCVYNTATLNSIDNDANRYLVSCTFMAKFMNKMGDITFSRVFIDEVDILSSRFRVSSRNSLYKTHRVYYVSANIKKMELDYLIDKQYIMTCTTQFIENSLDNDLTISVRDIICRPNNMTLLLQRVVNRELVTRFLSEENILGFCRELNIEPGTNDYIIRSVTEHYKNKMIAAQHVVDTLTHGALPISLAQQRSLDESKDAYKFLLDRLNGENSCVICYNDYNGQDVVRLITQCKHSLCQHCYNELKRRGDDHCPQCRTLMGRMCAIINSSIARELPPPPIIADELLSKQDNLLEIIRGKNKLLIFTCDVLTFDLPDSIKYLKGNPVTINKRIHDLRIGKINGLILDITTHSAGYNLEFVENIILFANYPIELYNQAVGRAVRIGRESGLKLNIWKLKYQFETN